MDHTFPFGFPGPTAFYLIIYGLTLILHVAFMNYVLAGSLYVAWANLASGPHSVPRGRQPLAMTLRDWMPFALGAAITAGVAPLLFLQILYRQAFYTANLLLAWRWLVLIPVLVVAFYLLYVLKSEFFQRWPTPLRLLVGIAAAGCFLFAAFCWTANHLLSLQSGDWARAYQTGLLPYRLTLLASRLAMWSAGAFPTMAILAAWQLCYQQQHERRAEVADQPLPAAEIGRLAWMSLGGLLLACLSAMVYMMNCPEQDRLPLLRTVSLPYAAAAVTGMIIQAIGWILQQRVSRFRGVYLALITLGCLLTVVGATVMRETVRLGRMDLPALYRQHASSAEVGGFGLFLSFAIINLGLIAVCVYLVRRWPREGA